MPLNQVGALAGHAIATDLLRGKKKEGKKAKKRGQDRTERVKIRGKSEILENDRMLQRMHLLV